MSRGFETDVVWVVTTKGGIFLRVFRRKHNAEAFVAERPRPDRYQVIRKELE